MRLARIYTRITMADGAVWYASCMQVKATPALTVAYLNNLSQLRRLGSTYELCTEEEYWEYRANLNAMAPPEFANTVAGFRPVRAGD